MNVQYIKKYTDEHGKTFECGWTAEHDDTEAQRRIDMGVCKMMPKGTFSRKNTTMEPPTECATMPEPTRFKDMAIDQRNESNTMAEFFVAAAVADAKKDYGATKYTKTKK